MTTIKTISIQQPCNQPWQQMIPVNDGRHCDHCCKTVVDFTAMSNTQVVDWLSNNSNVCGRFYTGQIEAINALDSYKTKLRLWKTLIAGIALVFILQQARAQGKAVVPYSQVCLINSPITHRQIFNAQLSTNQDSLHGMSIKAPKIKQDILTTDLPYLDEVSSHLWQGTHLSTVLGGVTAGVTIIKRSAVDKIWYQINSMYWSVYLPIISASTPSLSE